MNLDDVIKIGNNKMNLARNSYIISFMGLIIIIILLILLIRSKNKRLLNNLKIIIPLAMCLVLFSSFIIEGINAHIIANKIKEDSVDMNIYSLNGVIIEDVYANAKTLFIVIDSESYICREANLNTDASVGKKYDIKYLENSKLIVEMKEIY